MGVENPPAFPSQIDGVNVHGNPGMSLRDYFAGQAVGGLLAHPRCGEVGPAYGRRNDCIAREAYCIADAMLAERSRTQTGGES